MSGHNWPYHAFDASLEIEDPGDAGVITSEGKSHVVCAMTSGGAETRTLPDPTRVGIVLCLNLNVDGGAVVVTAASDVNQAGDNIMTFADAGDEITLKSVFLTNALVWREQSNHGVALT